MTRTTGTHMGPLSDGQTVAIIGGGPSGTACAIALKNLARAAGIGIEVLLYEGKLFGGETHYNQCVGVLSPPVDKILTEELDVPFPHHLVQGRITTYVLHSDRQEIELHGDDEPSYTLRRVQFDDYLLEQARARGVRIIHSRVTDVELGQDRVGIYSESEQCQADVVVGAFGLDDGGCKLFERATGGAGRRGYRQPDALSSVVTKDFPRSDYLQRFGQCIHAFLPSIPQIEFGAITPKRDHLTVNIAGAQVDSALMDRFLDLPAVRRVLPADEDRLPCEVGSASCDFGYYKGRFPISVAAAYYGDRYVVVGDAAGLVRPFKGKGVNSACISGLAAARAMVQAGVSKEAFQTHLASDARLRAIVDDLLYGRAIRRLAILSARYGWLDVAIGLAHRDASLRRALHDCVSANRPYREIVMETLRPAAALRTGRRLVGYWWATLGKQRSPSRYREARL